MYNTNNLMKCLCKLEIVPQQINPNCHWHGERRGGDMIAEVINRRLGRWHCPVCGHWVDEKAGWRITPEEEICGECYRILKGGEPKKQGDDQWTPR